MAEGGGHSQVVTKDGLLPGGNRGGEGGGAFTGGHQGVVAPMSTVLRAPTRVTIPYRIYCMSGGVVGSRVICNTRQNVVFTLRP